MHPHDGSASALLVVDLQVGLFQGPRLPYRADAVIETVAGLIDRARSARVPVFFARHTGPAGSPIEHGAPAWQLLPVLDVDAGRDTVFEKTRPSCFSGTALNERLRAAAVERLVIAGLKTEYCIDTTCRVASEFGYRPVLVSDAHTTFDTEVLPAQDVVRHHNLTLAGAFAEVVAAAELEF